MHYDLIVIGMGLSGLMAAKTAAEAGAPYRRDRGPCGAGPGADGIMAADIG